MEVERERETVRLINQRHHLVRVIRTINGAPLECHVRARDPAALATARMQGLSIWAALMRLLVGEEELRAKEK